MVLSASGSHGPASPAVPRAAERVVWHDLECGSYRADLPLWRELAERAQGVSDPAEILDVGAGSGRVALDLARAGHRVTALDLDDQLLAALAQRATDADTDIATVCGDARTFTLDEHDFGLCIAPMQTVQLLGGSAGRIAFLRRARAHLRQGGLLACAIVTALEPFDCAVGDIGPTAESARLDGVLYVSRPTCVRVRASSVVIERERRVVPPSGVPSVERDVIELDRVSSSELEREAIEAGFRPEAAVEVEATDEHVGSSVVMLRA